MSITDELREYALSFVGGSICAKLDAIADRIDVNHISEIGQTRSKAWNEGFDEGFASADDLSTASEETMAKHGWIHGPLDAGGVIWHDGDMSDEWGEIELISCGVDGIWYVKGHDTSAPWVRADSIHHQKTPKPLTIEDMLCEFATKMNDSKMLFGDPEEIQRGLITEYAAKLQLKDDAE